MIRQAAYTVEPWCVREQTLDLDTLAQSESVFALSNGHIGLRGNLEEGEPHGLPGTYLNSVYELRPLPYAEAGYGYPESGQTVINVTNGKLIRLLVEDEPFDVRYGELRSHERVLDFRAGTLTRNVEWISPAGDSVRIRTVRLVSLVQRGVAAIHYEVEPVDRPVRVVAQSELVANESLPDLGRDPRAAGRLESPLVGEESVADKDTAVMVHRTRHSGLRVAAAMGHEIETPDGTITTESFEDVCRYTVATRLQPGQRLRIVKYIAYGWSSRRSRPAVHDQVIAALAAAKMSGWDGLVREQREFLDDFWAGADVEVDGDAEVQQAVRFGLFHTLQAGSRAERRPIPAKGLTGPGYDGHTFWDTESFVLPPLTYTRADAAADALRWRHSTLDLAKERAEQLGLRGSAFPWRTIGGQECSGYWPAGTAAFHINADIADAVIRYVGATADEDFARDVGLELLVETARLWRALGHHDAKGRFRIDGVTGPDEYSATADNNVYTNLMAQRNLRAAADLAEEYPEQARRLGVTEEETAEWRDAAAAVVIPYDKRLEVHPQNEGFTHHARWDFENTPPDHYPLLLNYPYFDIYRKQVVKQADLVLAMHLRGDAFTEDEKLRNFVYYEGLTVRDSSLSACTQAVMAAETGHLELAHDYLGEAALMDLRDLEHNTRDGLHIASLAGTWNALVAGFGGMRQHTARLTFAPRLPPGISRLAFRMRFRGRRLKVTIGHDEAVYELLGGDPLEIEHHGRPVRLNGGAVRLDVPVPPRRPGPAQPPGREPARRDTTGR
ncbi:family 65 glycosyl hydrolase [Actinoallomurus purpureus]|uniref:glycoside hydrolase family 65 protein n=1 Tax=Actinoallomurus purpureus TaxID=478114 RepID=UPI0020927C6E|nr:glycosyl hydrolase family 65 protein [Actinoallomurus purpureus]MCO6011294.1 family 65 glycosyl hydrolase [Actinoallomurus purpureus]